ncbi:MAG TPA: CapA family protein [Dehalococcoidia bacterium]|nr:CapA family protein [Dehalococcoidia bacterium]
MNLFLCGDVMAGRGIDQILPRPSEPTLYEPSATSALAYVELAGRVNGPVPRPVDFAYIWGDALGELQARAPDLRLINLETSVTTSSEPLPKGINYRMHPANVPCLLAAGIDCCVLANNHVLDWRVPGLLDTLSVLSEAGIATAGAGKTVEEAARPAVFDTHEGQRVLVFAFGSTTSGIPADWAATEARPGVSLLGNLSQETGNQVVSHIRTHRRPGDIVVVSIHWGDNWGYEIPALQRRFAHHLIDAGVADLVHGHSSHHVKGVEVYEGRLILYGCGDFINDYEGIPGHEDYRSDLVLAYFADLDSSSGRLERLEMVPFRSKRLRLECVDGEDTEWLRRVLSREGRELGTSVELRRDGILTLRW